MLTIATNHSKIYTLLSSQFVLQDALETITVHNAKCNLNISIKNKIGLTIAIYISNQYYIVTVISLKDITLIS